MRPGSEMNGFDELAKALAQGVSRREALRGLAGGIIGALAGLAGLRPAAADGNPAQGNDACAHWCDSIYPPGPLRGRCKSDAAQGVGRCYECGPGADLRGIPHGPLCGTDTNRFCCAVGGQIQSATCSGDGSCSYICASGYATCDPNSPCGTMLGTSQNCARCGNACSGGTCCGSGSNRFCCRADQICQQGRCVCPSGQVEVSGQCMAAVACGSGFCCPGDRCHLNTGSHGLVCINDSSSGSCALYSTQAAASLTCPPCA